MIIEMAKIRLLGPHGALRDTVRAIQDEGVVQLVDAPRAPGLQSRIGDPLVRRRRRDLERALARIEHVVETFARYGVSPTDRPGAPLSEVRAARLGAVVQARVDQLVARERSLAEERDALRLYEPLFSELEQLYRDSVTRRVSLFLLRLRSEGALAGLRSALVDSLGRDHELSTHLLPSGEMVVLLAVPTGRAEGIDRLLVAAQVDRARLPGAVTDLSRMRPRLAEVVREHAAVRGDIEAVARANIDDCTRARRTLRDAVIVLAAEQRATVSPRAFVLEGWLPARERGRLAAAINARVGPLVTIEEVARHEWENTDAPVLLSNPRIFAPFEILTSLLPLPHYGSVDPTPFVAVFFPMLFGIVVGDVGYGLALAALAGMLRWAASKQSRGTSSRKVIRDVSRIALAVSFYSIIFGLLYGELFGDLGASWFGMEPWWFDRREAVLALLVLAVSLGAMHILIGLVIAAINRWHRQRRLAISRGVTAVMLIALALGLLALFEQVPRVLLMPAGIALLTGFAVIVALEGATALLEFMTVVNHVLSYARVMALGTASVMLAVVANRMQGAFGSLALGIAFALVFHLINFAIVLFSPTIHVMRLHYVEFFGTFFEPGGGPYQPLRHWSPGATAA